MNLTLGQTLSFRPFVLLVFLLLTTYVTSVLAFFSLKNYMAGSWLYSLATIMPISIPAILFFRSTSPCCGSISTHSTSKLLLLNNSTRYIFALPSIFIYWPVGTDITKRSGTAILTKKVCPNKYTTSATSIWIFICSLIMSSTYSTLFIFFVVLSL